MSLHATTDNGHRPGGAATRVTGSAQPTATVTSAETTATAETDLAHAAHLIRHGVPVFIAKPDMSRGVWNSDRGHGRTGYWLPDGWERSRPDPAVLRRWKPGDALCALMGHTVDGLDVDPRSGGDGTKAGLQAADAWPRSYGTAATPSGGTHDLVAPLGVHSMDAVAAGFDVKAGVAGDGHGLLFIAPTVKLNKVTGELGTYQWITPPDLDAFDAADDTGQSIADMIRAKRNGHKDKPTGDPGEARDWMITVPIPMGSRYPWLLSYAGWLRDKNVPYSEAEALYRRRWEACAQPPDAPYEFPWPEAEETLRKVYERYEPAPEVPSTSTIGGTIDGTELANARRLAATFGDQVRYVVPWRKWLIWDGQRWKPDDTGQICRYAKKIADNTPAPRKAPSRIHTAAGIAAMINLAGTEPGIALPAEALDSDPHLVNCQNGTLDLRTLELRPHDPADLITKLAGAAYRPAADAPRFAEFLARIQPDLGMRGFLGRLFGHALLGKVIEHILAILYGKGANGKTTLVEAITRVFGDYARPIDPGLLIDRDDVHPTSVAALFGLRLAITHESDQGRRLAEGTVKRLTGGDKITARRMREDFWDFNPSHSIVMITNHKPIVRGTDEGIWRRLRFVPFEVCIPDDEQDGNLPELLATEADGILAWIVAGYRQWQDQGLAPPDKVTAATAGFRGESDMLALFLAERCRTDAGPFACVQSSVLFAAWVDWCKRENTDAGTQTAFSRNMADRGYDKTKDGLGHMVWEGLDLWHE